jgi:fatty-acyl-CoA synthase
VSLARWIERHAAFTPDKIAIACPDQALSYAALAWRICRLAAGLREQVRIDYGDRIAFLGFNHPDFLVALFACARLGASLVPLNWRLAPASMSSSSPTRNRRPCSAKPHSARRSRA